MKNRSRDFSSLPCHLPPLSSVRTGPAPCLPGEGKLDRQREKWENRLLLNASELNHFYLTQLTYTRYPRLTQPTFHLTLTSKLNLLYPAAARGVHTLFAQVTKQGLMLMELRGHFHHAFIPNRCFTQSRAPWWGSLRVLQSLPWTGAGGANQTAWGATGGQTGRES